jgi:hypothetical protein
MKLNRSTHTGCLLILLLFTVFNVSCDDTTDFIGPHVIPDSDRPNVAQAVYQAFSNSVKVDSLIANTSECYLGRVTDPETSATTTCNFLAQFYSLEDYKLPPAQYMHRENGQIVADSVDLRLYIKSYYGDSLNSMKIGVYELDSANIMPENKDYYTNLDPQPYLSKSPDAIQKNITFSVTDLSLNDTARYSSDYLKNIRIRLPKSFGTKILNTYYQHPEYFKNAYTFIHHVFPGFYFKVLSGNGTIVHIDASTLNINFRYTVNDTTYTGVQRVAATEEVLQNNVIENKNLEKELASPDYTLIKSPAGVFTEVTIPVDSIYENHQNDSVNSAKIVFKRQNNSVKTDYALDTPGQILMIKKSLMNEFFSKHMIPNSKTSYLTSYDASYNSYTFTNIANLISSMKRTRDAGAGVSKNDNEAVRKAKIQKWEAENKDWNKVYLIPVTTETSSLGAITSIHNDFGLTSAKLIGSTNNPISISVVYSNFK